MTSYVMPCVGQVLYVVLSKVLILLPNPFSHRSAARIEWMKFCRTVGPPCHPPHGISDPLDDLWVCTVLSPNRHFIAPRTPSTTQGAFLKSTGVGVRPGVNHLRSAQGISVLFGLFYCFQQSQRGSFLSKAFDKVAYGRYQAIDVQRDDFFRK